MPATASSRPQPTARRKRTTAPPPPPATTEIAAVRPSLPPVPTAPQPRRPIEDIEEAIARLEALIGDIPVAPWGVKTRTVAAGARGQVTEHHITAAMSTSDHTVKYVPVTVLKGKNGAEEEHAYYIAAMQPATGRAVLSLLTEVRAQLLRVGAETDKTPNWWREYERAALALAQQLLATTPAPNSGRT